MVQYSSHTPNGDCIFCKIASHEMPPLWNAIIREDEKRMARLSPFPCTPGHTVVIPKKHFWSDVLKMPDALLQTFIVVAKQIAQKIENSFDDVGRVWLIMEWTGIDHAHIKLIPMHGTKHMKQWVRKQYLSDETPWYDTYPWYITSHDGPRADDEGLQNIKNKIIDSENHD